MTMDPLFSAALEAFPNLTATAQPEVGRASEAWHLQFVVPLAEALLSRKRFRDWVTWSYVNLVERPDSELNALLADVKEALEGYRESLEIWCDRLLDSTKPEKAPEGPEDQPDAVAATLNGILAGLWAAKGQLKFAMVDPANWITRDLSASFNQFGVSPQVHHPVSGSMPPPFGWWGFCDRLVAMVESSLDAFNRGLSFQHARVQAVSERIEVARHCGDLAQKAQSVLHHRREKLRGAFDADGKSSLRSAAIVLVLAYLSHKQSPQLDRLGALGNFLRDTVKAGDWAYRQMGHFSANSVRGAIAMLQPHFRSTDAPEDIAADESKRHQLVVVSTSDVRCLYWKGERVDVSKANKADWRRFVALVESASVGRGMEVTEGEKLSLPSSLSRMRNVLPKELSRTIKRPRGEGAFVIEVDRDQIFVMEL